VKGRSQAGWLAVRALDGGLPAATEVARLALEALSSAYLEPLFELCNCVFS
jgi:hypothetical protein